MRGFVAQSAAVVLAAMSAGTAARRYVALLIVCLAFNVSAEEPCARATASPEGTSSWPKCIDVTFTGQATGRPPLSFTWEVSNGFRFFGNPGVLRTENLDPGSYTAQLLVTNPWGQARSGLYLFSIEPLAFTGTPLWTNLGGRVVQFSALATGATLYRWRWGDSTTSPWLTGCAGANVTHTYPAVGTYSARLEIDNCEDAALLGPSFTVTATEEAALSVLVFQAFCEFGFCVFDVGEEVFFTTLVQGNPTSFAYDWDGNGTTEQVTSQPVVSHRFFEAGTFRPRLSISRGSQSMTVEHLLPLIVFPGSNLIFADGFEDGTTSAWSLVVGDAGGRPGQQPARSTTQRPEERPARGPAASTLAEVGEVRP